MVMIRLATVFSGIGAIEHAMQRMGLEHKIVFACDNGDLDIFLKEIGLNIDSIEEELSDLELMIDKLSSNEEYEQLYREQLSNMLSEAQRELRNNKIKLDEYKISTDRVAAILRNILSSSKVKKGRIKEYNRLADSLTKGSKINTTLNTFQVILKLTNDFKKDNSLDMLGEDIEFISSDGVEWKNVSKELKAAYDELEEYSGKKIIRSVQDLSQRTGQLHEKINYMKIQRDLDALDDDWNARKKMVDGLYSGLEKRNKPDLFRSI